jgi:hypothetical protein
MLKKIFDIGLIFVIAGLTGFVIYLSKNIGKDLNEAHTNLEEVSDQQSLLAQSFASRYKASELQLASVTSELEATKTLYAQSESMLKGVSMELASTKALLKETEDMLTDMRENTQSLVNISNKTLELQNEEFDIKAQMEAIKDHLRFLAGDIKDLPEGDKFVQFFKRKMVLVKSKIKGFKKEAMQLRIAAKNEHDRIKTILGNNGFITREGRVVKVDYEKFQAADLNGVAEVDKTEFQQNVNINVKFVD